MCVLTATVGLLVTALAQAPASAKATPICGQTLTHSVKLTKTVTCTGDGPTMGANGITLDLNGKSLIGNRARDGSTVGVQMTDRRNVTVKGGTITGFGAGVFIHRGRANTLSGLAVVENVGPRGGDWGDGMVILNSSDNVIRRNRVADNGDFDGIGVFGPSSTGNLIDQNTVEKNNTDLVTMGVNFGLGVFPGESVLEGGDHTTVSNNVIRDNGVANVYMCGVVIDCVTFNNRIVQNVIENTTPSESNPCDRYSWGISIDTHWPQQVPKPFPSGSYFGQHLIKNNVIRYNGAHGIHDAFSYGIEIADNVVYGNMLCAFPNTLDIQGDCDPSFGQNWHGNYYMGAPGLLFDDGDASPPPPGGCTRFVEQNHHLDALPTPPPGGASPPAAKPAARSSSRGATTPEGVLSGPANPLGPDTATVLANVTRGGSSAHASG